MADLSLHYTSKEPLAGTFTAFNKVLHLWRRRARSCGSRGALIASASPAPAITPAAAARRCSRRRGSLCGWSGRETDSTAALLRLLSKRQARPPHVDQVFAIGQPHRRRVEIDARRHVLH